MSGFPALEKACGGRINPETLTEFQQAMREYQEFMSGMRQMMAPVGSEFLTCGSCRTSQECTEFKRCFRE